MCHSNAEVPGGAMVRATAVLVLLLLSVACAEQDAETGLPAQDPGQVSSGETLYQANCAACHGIDLRGTDQGPSHLSIVYEPNHHGDAAFILAAKQGVRAHHWRFGDMAPIEGLTDDDLAAIVAYVRENQRIHGFEPYPP